MPNDKWSDDDIESLLRDFPKIQDERPKSEVYNQLMHSQSARRQPKRWLTLLVAAIAFFGISALAVSLLQQNEEFSTGSENGGAESHMAVDIEEADQPAIETQQAQDSDSGEAEAYRTALYETDLEQGRLFRLGLAYQAYVVPLSFLVPAEQLTGEETALALYEKFAAEVDEQGLGFDEYHPLAGEFEEAETVISHYLPEENPYDEGSAGTLLYFNSLEESFMDAAELRVLDVQGNPAQFSHLGTAEPLIPGERGHGFYLLESGAGVLYLAPAYGLSAEDPAAGVLELRQAPNDDYRSPVPSGLDYRVELRGNTLRVEFDEPLDLASFEESEAMRLVESMALTAKSYGMSLVLLNVVQEQWGGFDFTEQLELPVAPNRMAWPEK